MRVYVSHFLGLCSNFNIHRELMLTHQSAISLGHSSLRPLYPSLPETSASSKASTTSETSFENGTPSASPKVLKVNGRVKWIVSVVETDER